MAERGIIFSAPMVRALLDGRKTQTRRLLTSARVFGTPESPAFTLKGADMTRALQGAEGWRPLGGDGWFWESDAFPWQAPATRTGWMAHLPHAIGDRLYVRESWRPLEGYSNWDLRVSYAADGTEVHLDEEDMPDGSDWNWPKAADRGFVPSIHMPRWASRLTLTVTDVRVQRLQDIGEDDARAEGITQLGGPDRTWEVPGINCHGTTPRAAFWALWNSLHDKPGTRWEDNPWLYALTFTVQHGNIDRLTHG